jgi:hypothetical protein
MEATTETTSVEREIAIAASPETVWQFLVDPDKSTRWMGQTASFDPRLRGRVPLRRHPRPHRRRRVRRGRPAAPPRLDVGLGAGAGRPEPGAARLEHDRDRARPRRRGHDASVPAL